MTKEKKLALIWRHTHRDYRGKIGTDKAVLVLRSCGTCSVPLVCLTDEEIEKQMPYILKCEERRLSRS